MKTTEYNQLCNDSMAWGCIDFLFPGVDTYTPIQNIAKPASCDYREESGTNIRARTNLALNKRGMKFAHVNVVTLTGHFGDVDVLLEETALDVFAVTESRLDCTIPEGQVCPSDYVCYRKDRNRNGGDCAVFVKSKCKTVLKS